MMVCEMFAGPGHSVKGKAKRSWQFHQSETETQLCIMTLIINIGFPFLSVRDQARRTMYRPGVKSASRAGRNSYTRAYSAPNSSRTSSDVARNEMLAMVRSEHCETRGIVLSLRWY